MRFLLISLALLNCDGPPRERQSGLTIEPTHRISAYCHKGKEYLIFRDGTGSGITSTGEACQ